MPEKPYRLFPGHSFCTPASYLRDIHFASTLICTLHDTDFLLHSILAALESFLSLLLFASWAFMHRSSTGAFYHSPLLLNLILKAAAIVLRS